MIIEERDLFVEACRDIVVANLWMAIILIGIGRSEAIDKWLKADNRAIEELKAKVTSFSKKVERNPSLTDLMIMVALSFGTVSLAHLAAGYLGEFFSGWIGGFENQTTRNIFTFLGSSFFWMISLSTVWARIESSCCAINRPHASSP